MNIHFNYIRSLSFLYFRFVCFVCLSVFHFLCGYCRIAKYFTVDKRKHHFVPMCSLSKVCGRKYEENKKNDTKWMNYSKWIIFFLLWSCNIHCIEYFTLWFNQHFNHQTTTRKAVKLVDKCLKLLYINGVELLDFHL